MIASLPRLVRHRSDDVYQSHPEQCAQEPDQKGQDDARLRSLMIHGKCPPAPPHSTAMAIGMMRHVRR